MTAKYYYLANPLFGAGGVFLVAKDYAEAFGLEPNAKEQRLMFEVAPGYSSTVRSYMIMDGNLGKLFVSPCNHILTWPMNASDEPALQLALIVSFSDSDTHRLSLKAAHYLSLIFKLSSLKSIIEKEPFRVSGRGS